MTGRHTGADNFGTYTFWSHVALAAICCAALAMHFHLQSIGARGEVVGAGIFLLVMLFGVPALLLTVAAIFFSIRTSDRRLKYLTAAFLPAAVVAVLPVPFIFYIFVAVVYITLVAMLGVVMYRRRTLSR